MAHFDALFLKRSITKLGQYPRVLANGSGRCGCVPKRSKIVATRRAVQPAVAGPTGTLQAVTEVSPGGQASGFSRAADFPWEFADSMVDVHCHILPGLDDGPDGIEESLAMAESAINDGITHVVATPHCNSEYPFDYAHVHRLRELLQSEIGDRLELATGCDFHLNPENLDALRKDHSRFCINQHDYLLVEFNEISIPPSMDETLHDLQLKGLRPIITHPERNAILRRQPERLAKWVRLGCYVQVTAGSLTGTFGPRAQEDSLCWIGRGLVHFVASDAHNTKRRPLRLMPAYAAVKEQFGEEKARALFVENPLAAFEGRDLPYVPEIPDEKASPRRKRFFFF